MYTSRRDVSPRSPTKTRQVDSTQGYFLIDNDDMHFELSCFNIIPEEKSRTVSPQMRIYEEQDGTFGFIEQTEIQKKTENPIFENKVIIRYSYNWARKFRFELIDSKSEDELLYLAQTVVELGDLILAPNRVYRTAMTNITRKVCELQIIWDIPTHSCLYVSLKFEVSEFPTEKSWFFKKEKYCAFRLGRHLQQNDFAKSYLSEHVPQSKVMTWKNLTSKAMPLCHDDLSRAIKFRLYRLFNGEDKCVAETLFSLQELYYGKTEYVLADPTMQKKMGKVAIDGKFFNIPNALQYIRNGIRVNFMLAIDFSVPPKGSQNVDQEFSTAIQTVTAIMDPVANGKKYSLWGFGGNNRLFKEEGPKNVDCFSLTTDPKLPVVYGKDAVGGIYNEINEYIERSERPCLSKILRRAAATAKYFKNSESKDFLVLIIFTHGQILDLRESLEIIMGCTDLPIHFMIVGIGNGPFEEMEVIDGDEELRLNRKPDSVKFVKYNELKDFKFALPYELLRKLPSHLIEYNRSQNVELTILKTEPIYMKKLEPDASPDIIKTQRSRSPLPKKRDDSSISKTARAYRSQYRLYFFF